MTQELLQLIDNIHIHHLEIKDEWKSAETHMINLKLELRKAEDDLKRIENFMVYAEEPEHVSQEATDEYNRRRELVGKIEAIIKERRYSHNALALLEKLSYFTVDNNGKVSSW